MFSSCCHVDDEMIVAKIFAVPTNDEFKPDPVAFEPDPEVWPTPSTPQSPAQVGDNCEGARPPDPDARSLERFTVEVHKATLDQALGWHVDIIDTRYLFFCRLGSGPSPLRAYNAGAAPGKQLREGDYVVEVNGCTSSANDMMAQLNQREDVVLVVQRGQVFTKKIIRNGAALGVKLQHAEGCPSLCIQSIRDGALKAHAPEVRPGDRIVAVDGVRGASEQLMMALTSSENPEIQFSRAG